MLHRRLTVTASAVVVCCLSGCSVPVVGLTGIGVDALHRPIGSVAVCEDYIDAAVLYHDHGSDSRTDGSWTSPRRVTDSASWALDEAGAPRWRIDGSGLALEPGRRHFLYGATQDNSSSTARVDFTLADLETLSPGQIRWVGATPPNADSETYRVGTMKDFLADACDGPG